MLQWQLVAIPTQFNDRKEVSLSTFDKRKIRWTSRGQLVSPSELSGGKNGAARDAVLIEDTIIGERRVNTTHETFH